MEKEWRPCRLEAAVHARLTAYAESVGKGKRKWRRKGRWKTHPVVSLSEAVSLLLDQVEKHRERSKKAQLKRKAPAAGRANANGNGHHVGTAEVIGFTSTRLPDDKPAVF